MQLPHQQLRFFILHKPDFQSLFLQGREATFHGAYRFAFYLHIVSGPFVLVNGLILLSERVRRSWTRLHRGIGRVQAALVLFVLLPTGIVMSFDAFSGWAAGASFLLLSAATATCTIAGVVQVRLGRLDRHRRWMLRSFVLICSAVVLRLMSGAVELLGVQNPERAYFVAAWCSWLAPLAVCLFVERDVPNTW